MGWLEDFNKYHLPVEFNSGLDDAESAANTSRIQPPDQEKNVTATGQADEIPSDSSNNSMHFTVNAAPYSSFDLARHVGHVTISDGEYATMTAKNAHNFNDQATLFPPHAVSAKKVDGFQGAPTLRYPVEDSVSSPSNLFRPGFFAEPARVETLRELGLPHAHGWKPQDEDWHLPEDWEGILHRGLRKRLRSNRALRLFMEGCTRCGACADKCHYYLGTGDTRNMPVMRAELLRAVYRHDFTLAGRLLGRLGGGRKLTPAVVKEWFSYFYQCSECRRCAVFCPLGIDTAEITMTARELLLELGLGLHWIMEPVSRCRATGNHLGINTTVFREIVSTLCDDIEEITGIRINPPIDEPGHEVLFIAPSADLFAEPGIYTFMGYLMLLHASGLDYMLSTYASEGGNFGLFSSMELAASLNAKMYEEAGRLGAKWILGGECGHMWRVLHQYMDVMNGPAPACMSVPVNPLTGTVFEHAANTKAVHIAEYTADLIHHKKLSLVPSRNGGRTVTFHDSCNPARSMGLLDEPREILRAVCPKVVEMPEDTIREKTFCCGSGGGLNSNELLELRLRGGLPRGHALRHVQLRHGVDTMACICAIDRAALPAVADYWAPGVDVCGVHELVGNALVLPGEKKRKLDLRLNPLFV